MQERKCVKNNLKLGGLQKQQIELIINNKFAKHRHLVSSPQLIFKIADIANQPNKIFTAKLAKSADRNKNQFQTRTFRQIQNKSRKNYKQIKERIANITSRIQNQASLNLSEIFEYKQNVFAVFLQSFIIETSKQCKQKGQTLRFICDSFFDLIKIVVKKIVQNSDQQNRMNLANLAQAHQKYQNMLINALQKEKNSLQKQKQLQLTTDGLVYDLRFKRKEIKKLRASVATCTKRLNELKTSYMDLQSEHIELLMQTRDIGHQNAQFLMRRKLQINRARFDKLKLKQNKRQMHHVIKHQLCKDTKQETANLKKQLKATFNDSKLKSIKKIMLDAAFDQFDVRANMQETIREVNMITISSGLTYIDQGTDMQGFIGAQTSQAVQTRYCDMLDNNIIEDKAVQTNIVSIVAKTQINDFQSQTKHSFFAKHLRITYFPVFDIKISLSSTQKKVVQKQNNNKNKNSRKSLKINLSKAIKPQIKGSNNSEIAMIVQIKEETGSITRSVQQIEDEYKLLNASFKKANSRKKQQKNQTYFVANSSGTPKSTIMSQRASIRSGQLSQISRIFRSSARMTDRFKNSLNLNKKDLTNSQFGLISPMNSSLKNSQIQQLLLPQDFNLKTKDSKFVKRQSGASSSYEDRASQLTKREKSHSRMNLKASKSAVFQDLNKNRIRRANHQRHTSYQLQGSLVECTRFSSYYNDLLYRRVKSMVEPLQEQLKILCQHKKISLNISQKASHKIIGQVYYKCYDALMKKAELNTLLIPLLSILQINYGGVKKQDLMDKLKVFMSQSLLNRTDNMLQIFCFFLGLGSSQLSSKVTVIDLHTFLHLIVGLNAEGSINNIAMKVGDLYTSFTKTKSSLPQIFSSLGIHSEITQKLIQQMKQKYFDNSMPQTGFFQASNTIKNDIQNQKLDLFKVSHFLVQELIKWKLLYIDQFRLLISLAQQVNNKVQQKNIEDIRSNSHCDVRKITPVFMRLAITLHSQSQSMKIKKLRQLQEMFPNGDSSLWHQRHTQQQLAQLCLRVNVVALQHSLQYFLLKYQLTPNNYQKYFEMVRKTNLSQLIITTNTRMGTLKQQHMLIAGILEQLKQNKDKTDREKANKQLKIEQLLHFQYLEIAVNEVLSQIFQTPMKAICQSFDQFFSYDHANRKRSKQK